MAYLVMGGGRLCLAGAVLLVGMLGAPRPAKAEGAKRAAGNKAGSASICPVVVSDRALNDAMADWVADLRVPPGGQSALLVSHHSGLLAVPLATQGEVPVTRIAARGVAPEQVFFPLRLAVSAKIEAAAAFLQTINWRWAGDTTWERVSFEAPLDLDVYQDRILIFGVKGRDEDGNFAAGGEIAWHGRATGDTLDIQPLHYSVDGPGARSLGKCGVLGLSVARYLSDGSAVLVPGSEPGVFQYDQEGQVMGAWSATALGLNTVCSYSDKTIDRSRTDEPFRWQLIRERGRLAEEILPHPDGGFVVVLREAEGKGSAWVLAHLRPGQERASFCRLPITTKQPYAHLRGDVSGEGLVFLLSYDGYTPEHRTPPERPRLITLRWPE